MILQEVLGKTKEHFKNLGFDSAGLDAEVLLSSALKWKRLDLFLKLDYPLNESELNACRDLVRRRSRGEPVAYILGKKDFYNIEVKVTPDVLIPRPETEHLVDEALGYLKEQKIDAPNIIDLGAGSGCIGLALLKELPLAKLVAVERSQKAASIVMENAKINGLEQRLTLVNKAVEELTAEDFDGFSADVLVSNPPYIEKGDEALDKKVFEFEPHEALFAEEKGYYCYRTWPDILRPFVKQGAFVAFEMGFQQGTGVKELFLQKEYLQEVKIIKDYSSNDRVVTALVKN